MLIRLNVHRPFRIVKKCRDLGSSRGPSDLRSGALPTELSRLSKWGDRLAIQVAPCRCSLISRLTYQAMHIPCSLSRGGTSTHTHGQHQVYICREYAHIYALRVQLGGPRFVDYTTRRHSFSSYAPPAGLEPAIYGLEVRRLVH